MKSVHFLNGQLVNEDDLLISPRDLGYSRGYAVFEFMMTSKGRPFMLEKHIDRLYRSCQEISLNLPWPKELITEWVVQTLKANESVEGEKVMRVTISGGPSMTLSTTKIPTIVIMVDQRIPRPSEDYANGVHVLLSEFQRYKPQAKTNNYIEAIRQFNSIPNDIDEVIYHSEGMVREGTMSNVFAAIDGSLVTPKTGILEGITRDIIINKLQLSVRAEACDFSVQELLGASELFITATGMDIMPVTKLNDVPVGDGSVGPFTKEVMRKFRSFFESDLW
ncbi:MAG: aminotransferase class IV [Candidatus Levybacteria bacterium]|nr:aminotransferase class IV [Candidatus Levybacteria bacterium]